MDVILENVRCFQGEHVVPVTPITLLVGENSTGKSTLLAVLAALASKSFPFAAGFNTPPYDLGNYEGIATRKSANGKPAPNFKIGFSAGTKDPGGERAASATYKGHLGQVILSKFGIVAPRSTLRVEVEKKDFHVSVEFTIQKTKERKHFNIEINDRDREWMQGSGLIPVLLTRIATWHSMQRKELAEQDFRELVMLPSGGSFPFGSAVSIAPIRTKPRRTYDQFNEEFSPEGDHVPLKLARLLESDEADEQSYKESVKTALQRFGAESGLFERVEIERLRKGPGSAFQVAVYLGGQVHNLIDVGYGVSQSLPLIVQSLVSKKEGLLLMQQPEVHLHPKAQAALGTFFASLAKTQRLRFVIETHSDYLVDRVRQEVAQGTIPPEDVTILFFEKKNGRSKIHPITLDKEGNVTNAPEGYRSFFLEEEFNLLSRGQA